MKLNRFVKLFLIITAIFLVIFSTMIIAGCAGNGSDKSDSGCGCDNCSSCGNNGCDSGDSATNQGNVGK